MRASNPNVKIQADNAGLCTGGHFNGTVRLMEKNLDLPLRVKKPTAWAIWSDLFHEGVPDEFIGRAFGTMAAAHWHIFMILTKRATRLREWSRAVMYYPCGDRASRPVLGWPPNAWIGVTAENQETADERLPQLIQVPAAVRFVSVEPMLGPVNLFDSVPGVFGTLRHPPYIGHIQWFVCGGESGKNARPVNPQWVHSLRDQCVSAGVPFFFKQWGEWASVQGDTVQITRVGKKVAGRSLDGIAWNDLPIKLTKEEQR